VSRTPRRATMSFILAAVAFALSAISASASDEASSPQTSESSTVHVNVSTPKSFDEVTAAIEKQLGKFDGGAVAAAFRDKIPADQIEAKIHAMEGSSGLMLFTVREHGQLLSLKGSQVSARQYEVGNPLFALEMTQHDVRAGEYAPLRLLVYADEDQRTHIDYDLPSSVFGRLHSPDIDKVAKGLDDKLAALIANALK
jgi:uncharacterized protein (DUF302 family)